MVRKDKYYYRKRFKRIIIPYILLIFIIPSSERLFGEHMISTESIFLGNIMLFLAFIIPIALLIDLFYTIYKAYN
jgi:hypothetical protein